MLYIDGKPYANFDDLYQRFRSLGGFALHPDCHTTAFSGSTPVGFFDLEKMARCFGFTHEVNHHEHCYEWTTRTEPTLEVSHEPQTQKNLADPL